MAGEEVGKLVVEFEVEREVEREYNYAEKFLKYKGDTIPYKAIVKDGEFLAIVGRNYKLIPNEQIEKIVKEYCEKKGYKYEDIKSRTRYHGFVVKNDVGIVVHNSVDATIALRIDVIVDVGEESYAVFRVRDVYRRHTKHSGSLVAHLNAIMDAVLSKAEEYRDWLNELDKYRARHYLQALKEGLEILPKKYYIDVLRRAEYGFDGDGLTLRDVYSDISKRIWASNANMLTKLTLYEKLNELMFVIVASGV